jgi:hypothetical protein
MSCVCVRLVLYACGCWCVKCRLPQPVDNPRLTGEGSDGVHLLAHAGDLVRPIGAQTSPDASLHDPNTAGRSVDDRLHCGPPAPEGVAVTSAPDACADDPLARADALLAEVAAGVAHRVGAEVLLEAREIRAAEWARCRLVDRLRATRSPVRLVLAHLRVHGWVEGAGPDLVVLDDAQARWAVAIDQLLVIEGLGHALAEERMASDRLHSIGWAAHARDHVGARVRLHRTDGSVVSARLTAAGADHLDAVLIDSPSTPGDSTAVTIPYAALSVMASQSRMGGLTRSAASGRTCE